MTQEIDRLRTLKEQLQRERASIPNLVHVLFEWPDDGKHASRCPAPWPPSYPLDELHKNKCVALWARDLRRFEGWVCRHALLVRGGSMFDPGVFRFKLLARECGLLLQATPPSWLAPQRGKPEFLWLPALHELVRPDRLFTWRLDPALVRDLEKQDEMWSLARADAFQLPLTAARADQVHQCSVIEDAVFASIKAIDALIEGFKAETPEPRKRPRKPSREALMAYRLHVIKEFKQTDVAEMMSRELGRPIQQYQVSRWCSEARAFLEGGGVIPTDVGANRPSPRKTSTVDPGKLDKGPREDRGRRRPT